MQDKTAIIGYSGHAYVLADTVISSGLSIDFCCEKTAAKYNPVNFEYLGFEGDINFKGWERNLNFVLGIGDNALRHRIGLEILKRNKTSLNVADNLASLSTYSLKGTGNFIGLQVVIDSLATIRNFCILNTGCIIEHECQKGDAVQIAPSAVLAWNVSTGKKQQLYWSPFSS